MILGTGIDIIEVERIEKAIKKERFILRVFTDTEREYIKDKAQSAAGIFAAKEAAVKALGTGFSQGIGLHDIEIMHDSLGKPVVKLSGAAQKRMLELGAKALHISISNIKALAVAQAILED